MAKLKTDRIEEADLREYLSTASDFAFELRILKKLHEIEIACSHGGTYNDPVTGKPRQFDIRAVHSYNEAYRLFLAVECKNIRENFPLLVSCVPRSDTESFHEVVISCNPPVIRSHSECRSKDVAVTHRIVGQQGMYPVGAPVGKSCAQVGRVAHDGTITALDEDVYEKWAQAVSSAIGLAQAASNVAVSHKEAMACTAIVPILVVPDDMLWSVEFDDNGIESSPPRRLNRCPYFIGKQNHLQSNTVEGSGSIFSFIITHLEFVTETGLSDLLTTVATDQTLFPQHVIRATIAERFGIDGRDVGL